MKQKRALTEINRYGEQKSIQQIKHQEQKISSRRGHIQAQEKQKLKKMIEKRPTKQE